MSFLIAIIIYMYTCDTNFVHVQVIGLVYKPYVVVQSDSVSRVSIDFMWKLFCHEPLRKCFSAV